MSAMNMFRRDSGEISDRLESCSMRIPDDFLATQPGQPYRRCSSSLKYHRCLRVYDAKAEIVQFISGKGAFLLELSIHRNIR